MTTTRRFDDPPELASLSVEARLRSVRECCRLLGDFFAMQAEASGLACEVTLSTDAYQALTGLCHAAADELERLGHDLPPTLTEWPADCGGTRH
jgi:hypothetical protein